MNTHEIDTTTTQAATVYFGGSRQFTNRALVARVVSASLRAGAAVSVGCAIGADALVIGCAVGAGAASRLTVRAAFGPGGVGAWSGSAWPVVSAAAAAGASVLWFAGGPQSVPLAGRLIQRSLAGLVGASAAVFFLASAGSAGSLRVAAAAAGRGLPVFAFCAVQPWPLVGQAGAWQRSQFAGLACWAWVHAQASLF